MLIKLKISENLKVSLVPTPDLGLYQNAAMPERPETSGLIATLESPCHVPRLPPDFILDLSESGIDFWPPRFQTIHGTYLVAHKDALLFGPNNLVTPDGYWSCETRQNKGYVIPFMHASFYNRIFPGPKPVIEYNRLPTRLDISNLSPGDVDVIEEPVFLATPLEPLIWGRWVTTVLPKILHYNNHAPTRRFFCSSALPWQRDFLEFGGLPAELLLYHDPGRTYICRDVMTVEFSELDLFVSFKERENILAITKKVEIDSSPRKIFLSRLSRSRAKPTYRALQNEADLAGALEAIGFVTVEPELLTVAQQVGLFSKAEVVVCPGGSGIFNAAFCPPSARFITIESSGRYINTHAGVFASLGMRHGIIFGREDTTDTTDIHKRWTLDIPPAIEAIESFSA